MNRRPSGNDLTLPAHLATLTGTEIHVLFTNGGAISGTLNTVIWRTDEPDPSALFLVRTNVTALPSALLPWHAILAVGRPAPEQS